jgi:hypothetical protein
VITDVQTLESILHAHAGALGPDFIAYRNHTYRVLNLCVAFAREDEESREKIAVAAACHDLGIWTDATFDYLHPSVRLAVDHLTSAGRASWIHEVSEMILEHHKVTRCRHATPSLVESFRKADWVDVSRGFVTFGLSRSLVTELFSLWPSAGFHRLIVEMWLRRLRSHPLNSLPMVHF